MFLYNNFLSLDHHIFQIINGLAFKWVWLDMLGIFFSKYLIYLVIIATLLFLLRFRKNWEMVLSALFSGFIARFLVTGLIRFFVPRNRPFIDNNVNLLISRVNEFSFPSGHASFSFGLATVIYLYNKKWGIIFFISAILISVGRVFTGVHWPSDILAGAIVGIFSGWLGNKIFRKIGQICQ